VSAIDAGILTQANTQLALASSNAAERSEAMLVASAEISGFAQELPVPASGQLVLSRSLRDIPMAVSVHEYVESAERYGG